MREGGEREREGGRGWEPRGDGGGSLFFFSPPPPPHTCPNQTTSPAPDKDEAEIVAEIQAIMRQITACVSFLPLLSRPVSFDLLVYADKDSSVPLEWEDSDARMIEEGSANNVRLRSFTTKVHRVDAMVSYRMEPDDIC